MNVVAVDVVAVVVNGDEADVVVVVDIGVVAWHLRHRDDFLSTDAGYCYKSALWS